ncbi:MAG: GGDEF domain-containing protein [Lachnospiraceae bacterium]|nr:GGDEF domain-containing protein [Lachnospiraceae bacterium]
MADKIYLKKLVQSVVNNIGTKSNNIMFIRHYNSLFLTKYEIVGILEDCGIRILFHEYESDSMQEAYEPFLEWIREIYEEEFSSYMSVKEFIDECNVYPLLEDSIISFIETGRCIRQDEIIISEILEERLQFYDSLRNIFNYIMSKMKIFMVLSRIHLANYSSMEWLYEFLQDNNNCNYGLFMTFNESFPIHSSLTYIFKKFLGMVELNNYFFDWDIVSKEKIDEKQIRFTPDKQDISEYIRKLNNMYLLHATKQAISYLEIINQSIDRDKIQIDAEDIYQIYRLYALISISNDDSNTAILLAGNYIYNDGMDLKNKFWFNYIHGLAQISLLQKNMALASYEICLSIAKKLNDEYLLFKAEYLRCITVNYNWSQMFLVDFSLLNISEDFVEKLKKYGYENALAYIYVYSYENTAEFVENYAKGRIKELTYFDKGIEIGRKLNNTAFLRSAYMKNILLYSGAGYHDISNKFYEKRLEIVKLERRKEREAHTYNGMGFNCIITEKYNHADQYFKQALDIHFKLKNMYNIAETMYNAATNCFMAGDFYNAYYCVETAIYILDRIGLQSVQMCNASKLYGIAGLSCYYTGEPYKSISYLRKMELVMSHILNAEKPDYTNWYEDLCFYYMLKGIVESENDPYVAIEYLKLASKMQNNYKGNRFITYSYLSIAMANTYRILKDEEKAREELEKAIQYSMENGYSSKARLLISHLEGNRKVQNSTISCFTIEDYERIKKLARSEGNYMRLLGREKDISILSKWQETLKNNRNDENKLITNAMVSIINTFNLDGGIYIKYEAGKYKARYCDKKYQYTDEVINKIAGYFEKNPNNFLVNRIDKNFVDYTEVVDIFGVNNIATLIGVPLVDNMRINNIFLTYVEIHRNFTANKSLMSQDNLTMIKTAFEQLILACQKYERANEIEKMNLKLKDMSYRDPLTGLYNRQGLNYCIDKYKLDVKNCDNYVMYMDLDDFKTYNDLYGHAIGDKVLIYFSRVIKERIKRYGYSVRYGGDEFVAILHNINVEELIHLIDMIKADVSDAVTDILNKYYTGSQKIPDNKAIDCSIGIADFRDYSYSGISEALRRADQALYSIKDHHKGGFEFA